MSNKKLADFHIHTHVSLDGIHTIDEILARAKKYKVGTIAITDHNTVKGVHSYFKELGYNDYTTMIKHEDINIIAGTEVTVRAEDIENKAGKSAKFHILCYGFDRSPNSPLMRLLEMKRLNDIEYDLSYFLYLANVYDVVFDLDDIQKTLLNKKLNNSNYGEFKKDDVIEYLESNGYDFFKSKRELYTVLSKCIKPRRLNIELKDLVKIVHASGGICLVAHPLLNLYRVKQYSAAIKELANSGLDGFEKLNYKSKKLNFRLTTAFLKLNKTPITSCGSDFHDKTAKYKLGCDGTEKIYENNYQSFINKISTNTPKYEVNEEIEKLIKEYTIEHDKIVEEYEQLSQTTYNNALNPKKSVKKDVQENSNLDETQENTF